MLAQLSPVLTAQPHGTRVISAYTAEPAHDGCLPGEATLVYGANLVRAEAGLIWNGSYASLVQQMTPRLESQGWRSSADVQSYGRSTSGWTKRLANGEVAGLVISPDGTTQHYWQLFASAPPAKGYTGGC
jgi:hypothetical protein